jgi:hydrogenase maturation protease
MKTLVMGIGNPILCDDAVGIRVARKIKESNPALDVIETSEAGLALLDLMVDYEKIIIIDSIKTGQGDVGELFEVDMKSLMPSSDFSLSHGVDLSSAFAVGEGLQFNMPRLVSIYAVKVMDNTTFSESCTTEIENKIPSVAAQIMEREKL